VGKYKTLGINLNRDYRNDLNQNFEDIDVDIKGVDSRVSNIIKENPQPSEVVDARGTFPILKDRLDDTAAQLADNTSQVNNLVIDKNPSFVDQYVTSFFGRGQLLSEKATQNTVTEQNLTTTGNAGEGGVTVTDASKFQLGGILVVRYDDGTYSTHFIRTITGNTIGFLPTLEKNVTLNTKVERAWYNSAHPGKFYMRYLAQRLANETEDKNGYGENVFYANFDGGSKDDVGVAVGGATIGYNDAVNKASTYEAVLECAVGKVAYFSTSAVGGGIKLPEFGVKKGERLVLRLFAMSRNAANTSKISVKTSAGAIVSSLDITGATSQIMKPYTLEIIAPYDADRLYIEVTNQSSGLPTNVVFIDEVRVMRNVQKSTYTLPRKGVILGLGDSWVAGDVVSTPERESFLTHLATLLPDATIINKGVGGNKVQDLLARFDTDVIPNKPDVVIINTATNDAYNPASGTFDPNAIDYYEGKMKELIQKCLDIGAKPVVIGPPALAEEDGTATNFLLNDHSRDYFKRVYTSFFEDSHGSPTVKNTGITSYGKLDNNGFYLSGNNYKDVLIKIGTSNVSLKRVAILSKAFDANTSSNVVLKVYNAARDTLIATSNTVTIEKGASLQKTEFVLPITTLTASTSYVLAFEGTGLWSIHEGGSGATKNYGKFTVDNVKTGNTTPPATTLNKWTGVLLIPPIGTQKVFINNIPSRYTVSPSLTEIDQDSTVNINDDKSKLLLSFHAKLGEEFSFEQ
jgi:hypothetical protein